MFMLRNIKLSFLALVVLLSASTAKADLKPISLGAHASLLTSPYPGFINIGPTLTFLSFLRVEAGFAPLDYLVSKSTGNTYAVWGGTIRGRLPIWFIVPTVGIGYSQVYINAQNADFYGNRKTRIHYLTPQAGIEFEVGMSSFGFGLLYIMRRDVDGSYRKYDRSNSGNLGGTGLFPYAQIALSIF